MSYSESIENRLGVAHLIDEFEKSFDSFFPNFKSTQTSLRTLRQIKLYLYRQWIERRKLFKDSLLDSTDCLTLSILANLLAARKGVESCIARPKKITKYCHSMLVYEDENGPRAFKIAGRNRKYAYEILTVEQVEKRLKLIKPFIDFINSLRGNNIISSADSETHQTETRHLPDRD